MTTFVRILACGLLGLLLALSMSLPALASPEQYQIELDVLGNPSDIQLLGVEDHKGIWFGLREDQQVQGVKLALRLKHSPALIEHLSHINVFLNEQIVQSIPLDKSSSEQEQEFVLDLPVDQLQDSNYLRFHQVAHYTLSCEDPLHASLWTQLNKGSTLDFTVRPRALPNQLGLLPVPFFDARDTRRQAVTVVLPQRNPQAVQAAGIIVSWLGALSGYRGIDIELRDAAPASGAAIIIGTTADVAAITSASLSGPSLAMMTNPGDGISKLLMVTGVNSDELITAARALVLGGDFLTGPVAQDLKVETTPRQPYDAPNWLPSDRSVKFGELVERANLTAEGYRPDPISMHVRLPPDLYPWRGQRVPMNLKYRPALNIRNPAAYLAVDIGQAKVAKIDFNDAYLEFKSLLGSDPLPLTEKAVAIPLQTLATRATISFAFYYPTPTFNECENLLADNVRSSIDPDSTLDISHLPHFLPMPNMGAFFDAGYPFSKMADLSETAVVLAAQPSAAELEVYLAFMAKTGQSTGYPATHLSVLFDPQTTQGLKEKDLLMIYAGQAPHLLQQWKKHIPHHDKADRAQAVLTGFRSPLNRHRNVVLVKAENASGLQSSLLNILGDSKLEALVQGSTVALSAGQVHVLSEKSTYYTGGLGWWRRMQFFLGGHPWLLALLFVGGISLASVVTYSALRALARRRLRSLI